MSVEANHLASEAPPELLSRSLQLRRLCVLVRSRAGSSLVAPALVCLIAMSISLGGARSVQAAQVVVGDCIPGQNWGTLDSSFATQVLTLVNDHRTAMGLGSLSASPILTSSANWKSLHMAYYGYMDHNDPAPPVARTPSDRLAACGYPIGSVSWGENIAYGYSTPQAVMTAWLNSSGHRANIENASYRAIGVGVARASNGTLYWTQNFGSLVDSSPTPPPPVTAPTVSLVSVPASSTGSTSASFGWTTTDSPTSTTCSLDGAAAAACSSPAAYSGLAVGNHSFAVTVANGGGSNSASYGWTVTAPSSVKPPTVTFTQVPRARTDQARFAWKTTGSPTSVSCSLDGAPATPCSSPLTLNVAKRASHSFIVAVANVAGSASTQYTWFW